MKASSQRFCAVLLVSMLLSFPALGESEPLVYYRIEPGSVSEGTGSVATPLLPVGGAAATTIEDGIFPPVIPETGAENLGMSVTNGDQALWKGPKLPKLNGLTVEALGRTNERKKFQVIAAQFDGGTDQRAWRFGINPSTNVVTLVVSTNGSPDGEIPLPIQPFKNPAFNSGQNSAMDRPWVAALAWEFAALGSRIQILENACDQGQLTGHQVLVLKNPPSPRLGRAVTKS